MSVPAGSPVHQNPRLPKFVGAVVVLAFIGVLFAMSGDIVRERKVVLGRKWQTADFISIEDIDHRDWDRLLLQHVDKEGNVGYAAWKEEPGDVDALDAYLASLSRANPELEASRDARLAFWINAYNALTIRGILREYPAASVQVLTAGRQGFNLWRDVLLHVGDSDYSLGQIEHELLRPLREPRIHFAIVCGSRGCPRLLNRAYQSSDLEQQLRENSRNFFADPQKLDFDSSTGQLRLSPILKWYADDFGESQTEMLESIVPYLPDRVTGKLRDKRHVRAEYFDYDWTLNDQATVTADPPIPPKGAHADGDETPQEPE